jgi:hypothetical protein
MILRRYGNKVHSVTTNFDSRAMTEIGFMRDNAVSMTADEFESKYARAELHELTAQATGDVQGEVEEKVLADLRDQLTALESAAGPGGIVLIESESGIDYPKTRGTQNTIVEGMDNKLVFGYTIAPPLRVGTWRPK